MKPLEIWGGIECTLDRVGDKYINQCDKTGHNNRPGDLKTFKELGIQKLRYPCLWEVVAPNGIDRLDWSLLDKKLHELKELKLDFIASFLHHGSGPLYTSLIDPDFPEKFAEYARQFIQRYPWINEFTPINEINKTARFSCLSGHWYPHLNDELYYFKAVILQCKATVLAMREMRRVNLKARLIQTEDIGRCQSTEPLTYQRDFENQRRWLSFDLLCGKVNQNHALYQYMKSKGISDKELNWFLDNPCPPDVIGINHDLLSNRFLDHRKELYPEWTYKQNQAEEYADVGAVDTGQAEIISTESLFHEIWDRYRIRMAITECHARGQRETQMRWFNHIWKTANELREKGIPIESVTAWSLLGSYDWHNFCTNEENFYESGVFNLKNPNSSPAPTAMTKLIRDLLQSGKSHHPILASEGVWETPRRMLWAPKLGDFSRLYHRSDVRPILITGESDILGEAIARICGSRNIAYRWLKKKELDLSDWDSLESAVDVFKPWSIINTSEQNKKTHRGSLNLARTCKSKRIPLVCFSNDLNLNSHEINEQILSLNEESLIIKTSALFSPWEEINFVANTIKTLIRNHEVRVPNDMYVSPTYVPDLVNECLNLLIDGEKGIVHLANAGKVSWKEFAQITAREAKEKFNINPGLVIGTQSETLQKSNDSQIDISKEIILPSLEDALVRYLSELQVPSSNLEEMRL